MVFYARIQAVNSSMTETDFKQKTILLPKPRGFCAGVIRAIDIVTVALEQLGRPVYVRKEMSTIATLWTNWLHRVRFL
jgi:4-hydroxy-3-methylbut-2-enyl diphosphate reductase